MNRPGCWDLINPSDAYTFLADDHDVALAVVCLLGSGQYGARELCDEGRRVPVMLFGIYHEWVADQFDNRKIQEIISTVMEEKTEALCAALDSLLVGDRETFDALVGAEQGNLDQFKKLWTASRITSMNNISNAAIKLARNIREGAKKP